MLLLLASMVTNRPWQQDERGWTPLDCADEAGEVEAWHWRGLWRLVRAVFLGGVRIGL